LDRALVSIKTLQCAAKNAVHFAYITKLLTL